MSPAAHLTVVVAVADRPQVEPEWLVDCPQPGPWWNNWAHRAWPAAVGAAATVTDATHIPAAGTTNAQAPVEYMPWASKAIPSQGMAPPAGGKEMAALRYTRACIVSRGPPTTTVQPDALR